MSGIVASADSGLGSTRFGPNQRQELMSRLDDLQNELWLIEAIEARNKAQLGSFVDFAAMWEAQDEGDRSVREDIFLP